MKIFLLTLSLLLSWSALALDDLKNYDDLCLEEVPIFESEHLKVECDQKEGTILVQSLKKINLSGEYTKNYIIRAHSVSFSNSRFKNLQIISEEIFFEGNVNLSKVEVFSDKVNFVKGELSVDSMSVTAKTVEQQTKSSITSKQEIRFKLEAKADNSRIQSAFFGAIKARNFYIDAKEYDLLFRNKGRRNRRIKIEEETFITAGSVNINKYFSSLEGLSIKANDTLVDKRSFLLSDKMTFVFKQIKLEQNVEIEAGSALLFRGNEGTDVTIEAKITQGVNSFDQKVKKISNIRNSSVSHLGTVIDCINCRVEVMNTEYSNFDSLQIKAKDVYVSGDQGFSAGISSQNYSIASSAINFDARIDASNSFSLDSFYSTNIKGEITSANLFNSVTEGAFSAVDAVVNSAQINIMSRLDNVLVGSTFSGDWFKAKSEYGNNILIDSSFNSTTNQIINENGTTVVDGEVRFNGEVNHVKADTVEIREGSTVYANEEDQLNSRSVKGELQVIAKYLKNRGRLISGGDMALKVENGFRNYGEISGDNVRIDIKKVQSYDLGRVHAHDNLSIVLNDKIKGIMAKSLSGNGIFIEGNLDVEDISAMLANNIKSNKHLKVSTSEPLYFTENFEIEQALSLIAKDVKLAENVTLKAGEINLQSTEGDIKLATRSNLIGAKGVTLVSARDIIRNSKIVGPAHAKSHLQSKIISELGDVTIRAKGRYHEIASYTKTKGNYIVIGEKGVTIVPIRHTYQTSTTKKNLFRKKVTVRNHELYFSSRIVSGGTVHIQAGETTENEEGESSFTAGSGSVNISIKESHIPLSKLSINVAGTGERVNFGFVKNIYSENTFYSGRGVFKPVKEAMDAGSRVVKKVNHYSKKYVSEMIDFVLVDHGAFNKIIGGNLIEKLANAAKKVSTTSLDLTSSNFDPKGFYKIRENFEGAFNGFKEVGIEAQRDLLDYSGKEFANKVLGGNDRGIGKIFREVGRAGEDYVDVQDQVVTFENTVKVLATAYLGPAGGAAAGLVFDKYVMKKDIGMDDVLEAAIIAAVSQGVDASYGENLNGDLLNSASKEVVKSSLNSAVKREFSGESFTFKDFLTDVAVAVIATPASNGLASEVGSEAMRGLVQTVSSTALRSTITSLIQDGRADLDKAFDEAFEAGVFDAYMGGVKEALGGEENIAKVREDLKNRLGVVLGLIKTAQEHSEEIQKYYEDPDNELTASVAEKVNLLDEFDKEGMEKRKEQREKLLERLIQNEALKTYKKGFSSLSESEKREVYESAYEQYSFNVEQHSQRELIRIAKTFEVAKKKKLNKLLRKREKVILANQAILDLEFAANLLREEIGSCIPSSGAELISCSVKFGSKEGLSTKAIEVKTTHEPIPLERPSVDERDFLEHISEPLASNMPNGRPPVSGNTSAEMLFENQTELIGFAYDHLGLSQEILVNEVLGYEYDLNQEGKSNLTLYVDVTNTETAKRSTARIKAHHNGLTNLSELDTDKCRSCEIIEIKRENVRDANPSVAIPKTEIPPRTDLDIPEANAPPENTPSNPVLGPYIPARNGIQPPHHENTSTDSAFKPRVGTSVFPSESRPKNEDNAPSLTNPSFDPPVNPVDNSHMDQEDFDRDSLVALGNGDRVESLKTSQKMFRDFFQEKLLTFNKNSLFKTKEDFQKYKSISYITLSLAESFYEESLDQEILSKAEYLSKKSLQLEKEFRFLAFIVKNMAIGVKDGNSDFAKNIYDKLVKYKYKERTAELFNSLVNFSYVQESKEFFSDLYSGVSDIEYYENFKEMLGFAVDISENPNEYIANTLERALELKKTAGVLFDHLGTFLKKKGQEYVSMTQEERAQFSGRLLADLQRDAVFSAGLANALIKFKDAYKLRALDSLTGISKTTKLSGEELGEALLALRGQGDPTKAVELMKIGSGIVGKNSAGDLVEVTRDLGGVVKRLGLSSPDEVHGFGQVLDALKVDDALRVGAGNYKEVFGVAGEVYGSAQELIKKMGSKQFSMILKMSKGSRPNPKIYLSSGYIESHLKKFDNGATRFMKKSQYEKYGVAQIDGTAFVLPKHEADKLLSNAGASKRVLEDALGFPEGTLDSDNLVRIDILKPRQHNARIPSGNEPGVNDLWVPGGKLPNGNLELVLDLGDVPVDTFSVIEI